MIVNSSIKFIVLDIFLVKNQLYKRSIHNYIGTIINTIKNKYQ